MASIMIIDNNAAFRQVLKEYLGKKLNELAIDEAEGREEFWTKAEGHPPRIVLMDIRPAGENGLALAEEIKAKYPDTIIVILVTYDFPEYRKAALECGADHCLPKDSLGNSGLLGLIQSILKDQEAT